MFLKLFFYLLFTLPIIQLYSQETLEEQLKSIIENKKATVGIAVLYDGRILTTVNDKAGFPMMSTFKFPIAMAVLDHLDKHGLPLETELFITPSDLHPNTYSPLRDTHPQGNFNMTIGELLQYSVAQSDNNACDILIHYLGGTDCIQKYIRQLGIKQMRIVATEDQMHQRFENQMLNKTRPSSAVRLLERFLQKDLFSQAYYDFLEKTMIETSTGRDKLKGHLPTEVIVGHKTGSSDRNEAGVKIGDNDMGFVYLPNGKYYTIAVFVMNSQEDDTTNAALIAQISKTVYEYYRK